MKKLNSLIVFVLSLTFCLPSSGQEFTLSLEECLKMARTNDPEVRKAGLDIVAAKARKQEAFTAYLPTLSATAIGFQAMDPMFRLGLKDLLGDSDAANNLRYYIETEAALNGINSSLSLLGEGYYAGLKFTQPVFAGGRIANSNALASLGIRASELQSSMEERERLLEVESKYWQVVSLEDKESTIEKAMEALESLYKDATAAANAGLAVKEDAGKVLLEINSLKADQVKLRSGITLAKMDLFHAIGQPYSLTPGAAVDGQPFIGGISLTSDADGLQPPDGMYVAEEIVAAGLEERELLNISVDSKRLEKRIILGEALPQVGIGAAYGYGKTVGDPKANGAVFATVSIPISDWGKTAKRLRSSEMEVQKAVIDREYLDNQLLLKVRSSWVDLIGAWEAVLVSRETASLSETLLRQKESDYNAGLATMTEVLAASATLREKEDALTDSLIEYRLACSAYNSLKK